MTTPRKNRDPKTLRAATRLVHGGSMRSQFGETSEALFLTQGYLYDTMEQAEARFKGEDPGFIYSRFANPTVGDVRAPHGAAGGRGGGARHRQRHGGGDGGADGPAQGGRPYRRGQGAVRLVSLCRRGTAAALRRRVDAGRRRRSRAWRAAMRPNTKTTFLESPTNPTLEIIDIAGVAEIAHAHGATLVVDNVFATPLLQQPLQLGADCVVYSATKHIDGQGRVLGGVILASEAFIAEHIHNFLRQTGPSLSPFNAWVMLKSLETLPVRVAAQMRSAERIADYLAGHPGVSRVLYPGRADHPQAALAKRRCRAAARWSHSRSRAARRTRSRWPMRCRSSAFPTISATPRA